jgi:nucleoside-diphosphate-sugar epimerase
MQESPNLNIVLTGSAGYLGSRVKAILKDSGFNVIPLDKQEPVGPVDLTDGESFSTRELPTNYSLIHLAFPLPGKLNEKQFVSIIDSINKNLISRLSPTRSLVVSSTAVYPLEAEGQKESKPWEVYGKLKMQTEEVFSNNFDSVTIFRPGTLIENSRKSTMMSFLKVLLDSPVSFMPGSGDLIHPFTSTDDLVDAIAQWARNADTPCGTFDLVAAEPLTFTQIRRQSRGNQSARAICLPIWVLRRIGSDKKPLFGVSKWHFRALTYNLSLPARNTYSENFTSYSSLMKSL